MAEPLTDERLADIEARCQAATPGPWQTDSDSCCLYGTDEPGMLGTWLMTSLGGPDGTPQDGAFIAAARADVPDLVAEVRRLRAFIEGLMGDECTAFDNYLTGGPGSCPESDWPRDQWCLHCRSRVALAGHMEVGTG